MADTTRMIGRKATKADIMKNIKATAKKKKTSSSASNPFEQNKRFGQKLTPIKIKDVGTSKTKKKTSSASSPFEQNKRFGQKLTPIKIKDIKKK